MPQEGLNVFYRFFRDRISWFEADAVCQFHHASLVTVDNSFQFDATRDLLRELDVNDIVWIGLIRPQSSERFMWSNSRPLIANTGYWAESLPIMEAPLCAVIDPIRDYRWHALRCGGPETASFLCEMTVPSWADACILKDIPNLTMQYMADTASVELIRSCQEEGTLRQTCKGKQDRERIIRELVCPRERMEAQRINDITSSHFKSLKIINSVHTDNNENNDIELVPISVANYEPSSDLSESQAVTEKNTVQRLIEQFNVDELMQADQPMLGLSMSGGFRIPDEIPKPVKKLAKKYVSATDEKKKDTAVKSNQQKKPEALALEDMMLGDQPQGEPEIVERVLEDEVSNEIMEVLPHRKKILPQDLKTMPSILEKQSTETTAVPEAVKVSTMHSLLITTTTQPAISHPIHPHELHLNPMHEKEHAGHNNKKDTIADDNSHFIPPMLLVKSHYVPPNKHTHEHEHEHENEHENENENEHEIVMGKSQTITTTTTETVVANDISVSTSQSPVRTSPAIDKPTTTTTTTTTTTVMTPITTSSSSIESVAEKMYNENADEMSITTPKQQATLNMTTTTTRSGLLKNEDATMKTIKSTDILSSTELPELRKSTTTTKAHQHSSEENSSEEAKYGSLFAVTTTPVQAKEFEANVAAAFAAASKVAQQHEHEHEHEEQPSFTTESAKVVAVATTMKLPNEQNQQATTTITAPTRSTQTTFTTTVQPIVATTPTTTANNDKIQDEKEDDEKIDLTTNVNELESLTTIEPLSTTTTQEAITTKTISTTIENKTINDHEMAQEVATTTTPLKRHEFLWSDTTTTTFKPNRRRLLTKPETGSYFKKILG